MTIKEYLEKYKDKTLWSLAWSMLWRGWLLGIGAYFLLLIGIGLVSLAGIAIDGL